MSIMVHVALDVHEATIAVTGLGDGSDTPVFESDLINDPKTIRTHFSKWAQQYNLRCCYEASSCGYSLYRLLTQMGIQCEVIAPSLIPQRPGDHIKTDRRDARKLARLYRAGVLTAIHVPTEQQESDRSLLRLRDDLVAEVVKAKNQIHKFLRVWGLRYDGKSNWTLRHWKWLRSLTFEGVDAIVWREYLGLLEYKLSRLQEIERAVMELANSDRYLPQVSRLCCLKGIAQITAMVLLTELHDLRRFRSARALMAFLGLVPREHSSGARVRQGGITKAGNARCRRAVVEAAWKYMHKPAITQPLKARLAGQPGDVAAHSWKAQERLYNKYWGIAKRRSPQKAVVAVGRELVGFIWAMMTQFEETGPVGTVAKAAVG